jgi:hypothetical protein
MVSTTFNSNFNSLNKTRGPRLVEHWNNDDGCGA